MSHLVAIPAKLQNDLKQFQRLQQELGAVQQQRMQLELRLREIGHTLDELKNVPAREFEAVDESSLEINSNSGAARQR